MVLEDVVDDNTGVKVEVTIGVMDVGVAGKVDASRATITLDLDSPSQEIRNT